MAKKYVLTSNFDRDHIPAGTVVWDCIGHDYGLASQDTRFTGIQHVSVTFNENGDYPCFTIPHSLLKEVDIASPTDPKFWEANAEEARKYFGVNEND